MIVGAAAISGLGIYALPATPGLSSQAHAVLGITVFTVIIWLFRVINNGLASIFMLGLMILAKIPVGLALSGFSNGGFWVLLVVLFYGFAMQKTGLAERISYYILSLFSDTYSGVVWAFFVIGLILALGIPSMTVRTAIMVPVAWALVQSLGIGARSKGTALIMLSAVEMAVVPGSAFLYGSLNGPVVENVFHTAQLPLSWGGYAKVMTVPTLVLCVLILLANQSVLKPETGLKVLPGFAKQKLQTLGNIKRSEWVTGAVVVVSIVFWATGRIHNLPSFLIGMFALGVFGIAGVVDDKDIPGAVSWTLLLYIGGIFSLANIIESVKITPWLASYMVPIAQGLMHHRIILLLALAIAMFVIHFLDPSGFVAIPVLFLPVSGTLVAAGIPPMVVMAPLLLANQPFWASYQNFWIAMCEGMTDGQAFSGSQRAQIATTYAVAVLIAVVVSVGYWKMTGAL
jgi:anion transporter